MFKPAAFSFLFVTALLASPAVLADKFYRYVNDRGVVVIDRHGVPPEFVAKGYEVLNAQGRVLEVVPPAPSEEEMKVILEERARAESDAQLRRLYSGPADVERAKARKLQELDAMVALAESNLGSLQVEQASLQAQAAAHERAGRAVPADLVGQIDTVKAEQENLRRRIERFAENRKQIVASFDADRDRLAYLLQRRER